MSNREAEAEVRRIRAVYALRELGGRKDRLNAGRRVMADERDRRFAQSLDRHLTVPIETAQILDVGCGDGGQLDWLRSLGARGANLHGVDLLPDKIARARRRYSDFHLVDGNAEALPFEDRSFDLLVVMTVFSSILDPAMARNVAAEIARVLRPGGLILWYDIRYPNPWNSDVRAMTLPRILGLFPGFAPSLETATLIPQLARTLGHLNEAGLRAAYGGLAALPVLRSHLLGVLRAPARKRGG